MPQTETPPTIEVLQKAIALIEQCPDNRAIALTFLEQLTQQSEESRLMQIIEQQPAVDRTRLHELRDRCEYGHLTPEEHQELIQFEDELERHNVDRITHLIELAKHRQTTLPQLMNDLGLKPIADA